jgi:hypothetical protein
MKEKLHFVDYVYDVCGRIVVLRISFIYIPSDFCHSILLSGGPRCENDEHKQEKIEDEEMATLKKNR